MELKEKELVLIRVLGAVINEKKTAFQGGIAVFFKYKKWLVNYELCYNDKYYILISKIKRYFFIKLILTIQHYRHYQHSNRFTVFQTINGS